MKKLFAGFLLFTTLLVPSFLAPAPVSAATNCTDTGFFGLPSWHKYLEGETVTDGVTGFDVCNIRVNGIGDVWLVAAAVIEILLRVAALAAVAFIIYGGVLYILSQSQPDKTSQALKTVINAVVGLVIAVVASSLVAFVAGSF